MRFILIDGSYKIKFYKVTIKKNCMHIECKNASFIVIIFNTMNMHEDYDKYKNMFLTSGVITSLS